jgi:hypothetical protein
MMTMSRRVRACAGVLAVCSLGMLGALPATASAAVHHPARTASSQHITLRGHGRVFVPDTGFNAVQVCDEETPQALCMNGYDGDGAAVKGYPLTGGRPQTVDVTTDVTACGGPVTASCPFTPGLGLNNTYINKSIVTILNEANQFVYRSASNAVGIIESGAGNGLLWVQVGDLAGSHAGALLINVYASDQRGEAVVACTSGTGAPLTLEVLTSHTGSNCEWGVQG